MWSKWRERARAWWRRNVVDDDPYEIRVTHEPHATSSLFIVNGSLMDAEGLRVWAHWQMLPSSVRRSGWN